MRLCSGAGCGRAVSNDARYCDACKAERTAPTQSDGIHEHTLAYTQYLDALRKGTRWQRIRERVLGRDPMCKLCDRALADICDHVVPAGVAVQQARDSGRYPYDKAAGYYLMSNLQGLCRMCHYTKTLEDKAHVGPWPNVVEIEAWAKRRRFSF